MVGNVVFAGCGSCRELVMQDVLDDGLFKCLAVIAVFGCQAFEAVLLIDTGPGAKHSVVDAKVSGGKFLPVCCVQIMFNNGQFELLAVFMHHSPPIVGFCPTFGGHFTP